MTSAAAAVSLDRARDRLSRVFGFDGFRPGQDVVIRSILDGEDVLAVMPTGGGKSLCYQLPALLRPGLAVVVSPLIALMRDQVLQLRTRGVAAGALHSACDEDEAADVERALAERRLKLLYVAPERLALPGFVERLKRAGAAFFAVDEAHCIAQWGHDFRPDYATLRDVAAGLGGVQTAAFTATASAATRAEIVERLFLRRPRIHVQSFDRPNLHLAMAPQTDAFRQVAAFVAKHRGQSGIVYCASRDRAERFATALSAQGHRAIPYHAGLDAETRAANQDAFLDASGVVMCATIAFGMGVDKRDTRFVCHADTPDGVEAYYQEIGRGGRDGLAAQTLTLWSRDELAYRRRRLRLTTADDPAHGERALRKLDQLLALCEGLRCRRVALLACLDEATPPCGHCDICDGGLGRRALGGVRRIAVGWRPHAATLCATALEASARWLRPRNVPKELQADAAEPLRADKSLPVMGPVAEPAGAPGSPPLSIGDRRLLAALRATRLAVARATGRPAQTIATDDALRAILVQRPRVAADMAALLRATTPTERHVVAFLKALRGHERAGG